MLRRRLGRRVGALALAGTALASVPALAACESHTAYYHCSQAVSNIRKFPGHQLDYLAIIGARTGRNDYCTIRSGIDGDTHYHYVVINIDTEEQLWYNYG